MFYLVSLFTGKYTCKDHPIPNCTVGWGGVEYTDCISAEGQDSPNECSVYDTKQSHDEEPVMLELWGMRSIPLLPSLPGLLWPGVVALNRDLSICQIELFDF